MQINLDRKNLSATLAIALFFQLSAPTLFPSYRLNFITPFLIILYYQKNYHYALWSSLGCGFVLDLLSAPTYFGLYAMSFAITTAILYRQRQNFFADSLTTLPLMTLFFSGLTALVQLAILTLFVGLPKISAYWIFTDIFYMPSLDALYAFLFFVLPAFWLGKRPRRGKDYFMESN